MEKLVESAIVLRSAIPRAAKTRQFVLSETFVMLFLKRIPKIGHIVPVYAVLTTITYAWSMIHFFWNLPSWLYFSTMGEIFVIFTYMIVANFIESLLVLFLILSLYLLLSRIWTLDQFIVKSVLITLIGLGFLIYRNHYFPTKALYALTSLQWAALLVTEGLILIAPFNKIQPFSKAIENLADRFIVFLYITIPISVVSLVIVIFRNLF